MSRASPGWSLLLALAHLRCGGEAPSPPPPTVCTSDTRWTEGNTSSARMNPGLPCVGCHASTRSTFSAAGTVYPTRFEPDLCVGHRGDASDPAQVELEDSAGQRVTLPVNSGGNFYHRLALSPPLRVTLRWQGRARRMQGLAPSGECNGCHTERGREGAPGRVLLP